MSFEVHYSKEFKRNLKKLNTKDSEIALEIIERLSKGETLEPKYKDHKLRGKFKDFRECHIKPDLLLIYQKLEKKLILIAINVGSHSDLF